MAVTDTVATDRPTACCRVSGVKRANSALRVVGSFLFRPGARTPRVIGGALRASAPEIVHTYVHIMTAAAAAMPHPTTHGEVAWRES